MLKFIFRKIFSKELKEFERTYSNIQRDYTKLKERSDELLKENSELKSKCFDLEKSVNPITEDDSYITFVISNDLKVEIKSKVNTNISTKLVDEGFVQGNEAENVEVLQMALLLIANESSEQIIMGVNSNED